MSRKRKYSDEQIKYLKELDEKQLPYEEVVKIFNEKYGTEYGYQSIKSTIGIARKGKIYNRHYSDELKEKISNMHENGMSPAQIGRELDISEKAISAFLCRRGIHSSNRIEDRMESELVEKIISEYQSGKPAREILQLVPNIKCENTIINILRNHGVEIRKGGKYSPISNENIFEKLTTPEAAYMVGFAMADGCVLNIKRPSPATGKVYQRSSVLVYAISSKDAYLLEKFKSAFGVDKKIVFSKDNTIASLSITSNKITNDIAQYNVVPRKTWTLRMPSNVPLEMMPHLIRGLFDGDGCIYKKMVTFYGNREMMQDTQNFLVSQIGISKNKISEHISHSPNYPDRKSHVFSFSFSSRRDVNAFFNYIYKDSENMRLERKYDRFLELDYIERK